MNQSRDLGELPIRILVKTIILGSFFIGFTLTGLIWLFIVFVFGLSLVPIVVCCIPYALLDWLFRRRGIELGDWMKSK